APVVSEVVDLELARLEVEVGATDPVLAPLFVKVRFRPEADVARVHDRAVGDRPIGTVRERRRDDLTAGRVLAAGRPPSPIERADVGVVEAARAGPTLEARALERGELDRLRAQLRDSGTAGAGRVERVLVGRLGARDGGPHQRDVRVASEIALQAHDVEA